MRSIAGLRWFLALFVGLLLRAAAASAAEEGPVATGSPPADIVAETVDRDALLANLKISASYDGQPLLLVLHRGITCVRCVSTLSVIGRNSREFRDLEIQVLAVSPSLPKAETLPQLRRDLGIGFPLLDDPELAVFRQFGCLSAEAGPLHGLMLIDAQGHIRWSQVSEHAETDLKLILQRCRESIDPGRGNP